eukprot:GHVL01043750.1.p1 GENE.GHVL01043750.1~~GHVL01043750.1.p1  ORF type:complete len:627 (+),score=190.97 GHVL01043750.1:267-1883(+)
MLSLLNRSGIMRDSFHQIRILINIGSIYWHKNIYENSIKILYRALEYIMKNNRYIDRIWLLYIYRWLLYYDDHNMIINNYIKKYVQNYVNMILYNKKDELIQVCQEIIQNVDKDSIWQKAAQSALAETSAKNEKLKELYESAKDPVILPPGVRDPVIIPPGVGVNKDPVIIPPGVGDNSDPVTVVNEEVKPTINIFSNLVDPLFLMSLRLCVHSAFKYIKNETVKNETSDETVKRYEYHILFGFKNWLNNIKYGNNNESCINILLLSILQRQITKIRNIQALLKRKFFDISYIIKSALLRIGLTGFISNKQRMLANIQRLQIIQNGCPERFMDECIKLGYNGIKIIKINRRNNKYNIRYIWINNNIIYYQKKELTTYNSDIRRNTFSSQGSINIDNKNIKKNIKKKEILILNIVSIVYGKYTIGMKTKANEFEDYLCVSILYKSYNQQCWLINNDIKCLDLVFFTFNHLWRFICSLQIHIAKQDEFQECCFNTGGYVDEIGNNNDKAGGCLEIITPGMLMWKRARFGLINQNYLKSYK